MIDRDAYERRLPATHVISLFFSLTWRGILLASFLLPVA
jgi:hypothetical protein